VGFPPFGVREEDGLQIGDGDVNERRNWSIDQFVKPRFSIMES